MGMNLVKQVVWLLVPGSTIILVILMSSMTIHIILLFNSSHVSGYLCFRIAVYKVLYRLFGGFVSDVVAAIEQVIKD